ncbi:MAG: hypothetical protein LBC74_11840 [Planctomycetaceae bacterium]|jgi:hypothetical protein|nr:hypothetical protein [Planctomycetaceae bacterium]
MNKNESFELSSHECQSLQELADGWETIWEKISVELINGRLHKATAQYRFDNPEIDIDDFVSFVYERYHKEVLEKTRFLTYNYKEYGGDVFKFLCNSFIIRQMFIKYRRENTLIKTPAGRKAKKFQYDKYLGNDDSKEPSFTENIESPETQAMYYDKKNLCEIFLADNWILVIPAQTSTGNFSKEYEQAGLQLYPRIDYTNTKMEKLQKHVHHAVAKVDKSDMKPDVKIQREHKFAKERIDEEINKLAEQLYDYRKQMKRKIDNEQEKNIKRKIDKKNLQEMYRPLNAEQIVDLLSISRSNADKILSRYYKILTEILPLPEETKELFKPLFNSVFKKEGEKK